MHTNPRLLPVLTAVVYGLVGCSGASQPRLVSPDKIFQDCDACPEMVVIPAGDFLMGSPESEIGRAINEGPQHNVAISRDFAVSRFEVTHGQYGAFVQETRYRSGNACVVWTGTRGGEPVPGKSWQDPNFSQTDDHPVVCITWADAKAYGRWLSRKTGRQYRLLTEAEWEYAARAGTVTRASFGDGADNLCRYANVADQSARDHGGGADWVYADCRDGYGAETAPVGSFQANPFGLYDMHGNVWEWTEDCYHESYVGAPADETAWTEDNCQSRVVRGSSLSAPPVWLRSASRSSGSVEARMELELEAVPDFHNWNLGFRIARALE